jgi:transglutaminase-like putative cysteine protease
VAFRVVVDGPTPPADQLYWRGPVLWTTDGRRWDPIRREFPPPWFREAPTYEMTGEPVRYALTLEPHDERWLFALDLPAAAPAGVNLTADFQLLLPRKAVSRQRYELASHTAYRTGPLPQVQQRLALQLPPGRNPRSRELARQWSALTPAEIVRTALALFRDQPFWYTRQPPLLGDDAIDEFLFDSRRGFCEHYAAAFVTLMRGAGLPARVVTGYQGAEGNPLADYLIVRQSRAHAWAEVWLEGEGWVRVDPTAVIPPQRVETDTDLRRFRTTAAPLVDVDLSWLARNLSRMRYGWDALNNAWNQWVLGYNHERQKELLQRLGLLAFGWQGALAFLFGAIGMVLATVALYLLRRGRGRPDAVVRLYERYCRKLARVGLGRAPHEGPADFARRVAAARPDLARAGDEITTLYIALRYGAAQADALRQLRGAVQRFRPATR